MKIWIKSVLFFLILILLSGCQGKRESEFTFYIYGDSRSGDKHHRKIVNTMLQNKADFIVNTGDLVSRGDKPELWERFIEIIQPIKNSSNDSPTYFGVIGNHDINGDDTKYSNWHKYLPGLPGNGEFYCYDHKNLRMIVLNSCVNDSDNVQTDSLKSWLKTNNKKWLIVLWHHPSYPFGKKSRHHQSIRKWWPLLYKYNVDIVFNGHAHHYVRTYPIRPVDGNPFGIRDDQQGVVQVITGGGGAQLYSVGKDKYNQMYFDSLFAHGEDQRYHFCEITVSNSSLILKAKYADGTEFDRLSIGKRK